MSARRASLAGSAALVVAWLAAAYWAFPVLRDHAPSIVRRSMSLSTFRIFVQLLVLGAGGTAFVAIVPEGRRLLGLGAPRPLHLAQALLAAPLAFVTATIVSVTLALPILLRELAERGAGASRANAGAFATELQESPALVIVLAGALLAPLGEELLFRGALYGTVREALARAMARPVDPDVPIELQRPSPRWLIEGAPLVVAGAVFAAMHADMPGGVGVVRVTAAAVLSLFTGLARATTGSVLPGIALHAGYNGLALLVARGFFRGSASWSGAPKALVVAGLLGAVLAALAQGLVVRRTRRAPRDAP